MILANIYSGIIYSILIFILTDIIGLLAMAFLNYRFFYNPKLPGVFHYNNVIIGDGIIFPALNSYLFYQIYIGIIDLKSDIILISIVLSGLTSIVYFIWRVHFNPDNDWSRPQLHKINLGGIYHVGYYFLQLAILLFSFISSIRYLHFKEMIVFSILTGFYLLLALFPTYRLSIRK